MLPWTCGSADLIRTLPSLDRGLQGLLLTQPGITVVCGDSHTSTHGAFGALAHGIGTSEVEHVMATQCLVAKKSKAMLVQVDGQLHKGVTAKDIALAVIGKIGTAEVATDPMPPSVADTFVIMKDREQWPDPTRSKADLVAAIEKRVEDVPGNNRKADQNWPQIKGRTPKSLA